MQKIIFFILVVLILIVGINIFFVRVIDKSKNGEKTEIESQQLVQQKQLDIDYHPNSYQEISDSSQQFMSEKGEKAIRQRVIQIGSNADSKVKWYQAGTQSEHSNVTDLYAKKDMTNIKDSVSTGSIGGAEYNDTDHLSFNVEGRYDVVEPIAGGMSNTKFQSAQGTSTIQTGVAWNF